MQPKPAFKKLETYLIIALLGGMMDLVHLIVSGAGSVLPPQYGAIVAAVLSLAAPALLGYFAKLRHDAYVSAGLPDPSAAPAPSLPQAVAQLNAK